MKKLLAIAAVLFSVTTFAQKGNAVINALKSGSAATFATYFDISVDVKLPQQNEMKGLTKSDAANAIQSFFANNQITGCDIISQREMGGTMYVAGKLKGSTQSYNITVMMKITGNNMSVITIRIG